MARISSFAEEDIFDEFDLPKQTQSELTLCSHKPRHLKALLESLPSTQNMHVSAVLYKLIPELNQLILNGSQRLELLKIIRPYVYNCTHGLTEHYLKHPLSLEENTTRVAAIGHSLQRRLCDGYMICAKQLLTSGNIDVDTEFASALYYAIHGLGQLLFRCHQLYTLRPTNIWKKLHYLYLLAKEFNIEQEIITDPLLETQRIFSIEKAYFRILVLGCSNTNQLRQMDITILYRALEKWSALITLQTLDNKSESSIYMVDLTSDRGPSYLSKNTSSPSSTFVIDFSKLIETLCDAPSTNIDENIIPAHNRQTLLAHLLKTWKNQQQRTMDRISSNVMIEICVGLKSAHEKLITGTEFEEIFEQSREFPFGDASNTDKSDSTSSTIFSVSANDESREGYCLCWTEKIPPQIKAGEVLLLRKKGHTEWKIGTIRWAQRLNGNAYVGVQLLDGRLEAAAASTTLENGETTPFFRSVLLKPEYSDQKTNLLTPTIPFNSNQMIQLQLREGCQKAQLTQLLTSSGSVSLFNYRTFS